VLSNAQIAPIALSLPSERQFKGLNDSILNGKLEQKFPCPPDEGNRKIDFAGNIDRLRFRRRFIENWSLQNANRKLDNHLL
jgi:hypothetical protein